MDEDLSPEKIAQYVETLRAHRDSGRGWYDRDETWARDKLQEHFDRIRARESHVSSSVPPLYESALVSDFTQEDFEAPFEEGTPRDIKIRGANGAGKSHLGAALALSWGGLFVSSAETAVRIRASFRGEGSEREILAELGEAPLLVLDDIFAPASTDFWCASLLVILERRITHRLPTVVTTDKTLVQIDERDSSIASRLASFENVVLKGGDRRLRRAKEQP